MDAESAGALTSAAEEHVMARTVADLIVAILKASGVRRGVRDSRGLAERLH
jgi:hypothetical protein